MDSIDSMNISKNNLFNKFETGKKILNRLKKRYSLNIDKDSFLKLNLNN